MVNDKEEMAKAVAHFEKNKQPDGAYYMSPKKVTSSNVNGLVIFTIVFVSLFIATTYIPAINSILGSTGALILSMILATVFMILILRMLDKRDSGRQSAQPQFKLFNDHIVLLPQGTVVPFSDIEYIDISTGGGGSGHPMGISASFSVGEQVYNYILNNPGMFFFRVDPNETSGLWLSYLLRSFGFENRLGIKNYANIRLRYNPSPDQKS